MSRIKKTTCGIAIVAITLLTGCAGSGSGSTAHYGGYYDPYAGWGRGNDTTIIITNPDKPEKPERPERPEKPPISKPPISKPSGGMGRPRPRRSRG